MIEVWNKCDVLANDSYTIWGKGARHSNLGKDYYLTHEARKKAEEKEKENLMRKARKGEMIVTDEKVSDNTDTDSVIEDTDSDYEEKPIDVRDQLEKYAEELPNFVKSAKLREEIQKRRAQKKRELLLGNHINNTNDSKNITNKNSTKNDKNASKNNKNGNRNTVAKTEKTSPLTGKNIKDSVAWSEVLGGKKKDKWATTKSKNNSSNFKDLDEKKIQEHNHNEEIESDEIQSPKKLNIENLDVTETQIDDDDTNTVNSINRKDTSRLNMDPNIDNSEDEDPFSDPFKWHPTREELQKLTKKNAQGVWKPEQNIYLNANIPNQNNEFIQNENMLNDNVSIDKSESSSNFDSSYSTLSEYASKLLSDNRDPTFATSYRVKKLVERQLKIGERMPHLVSALTGEGISELKLELEILFKRIAIAEPNIVPGENINNAIEGISTQLYTVKPMEGGFNFARREGIVEKIGKEGEIIVWLDQIGRDKVKKLNEEYEKIV